MLKQHRNIIHLLLFCITLLTTTLAGAEWITGKTYFFSENTISYQEFLGGLYFSLPFLGILTAHEFGHYFTAKFYRLNVTLPYYIPMWFGSLMPSIGTMGAFIRIESSPRSRKEFFDVGIAGPLAGFLVALGVVYYGFTHLPPPEHIFTIHPEYAQFGLDYAQYVYQNQEIKIIMGDNLLFYLFREFVADKSLLPNEYEIMHYPFLLAGFLACFFTALNLFPVGQMDGGHILYGLMGAKWHRIISPLFLILLTVIGGIDSFSIHDNLDTLLWGTPLYIFFLYLVFSRIFENSLSVLLLAVAVFTFQFFVKSYFPEITGFQGWLAMSFLIGRILGVYHPTTYDQKPLNFPRKLLGFAALIIFVLCFSPEPLIIR
ncbi:MAG: site-2 protease family protein [Cytophagales bacterium]|nr:site-2 protease family protein [Cytophagales bacterium]MDW8384918.1 site-2 protease family protein [Flammeovirgaceae bacterium]